MNPEEIWRTALGELEVNLSKANFTTWFKDTFLEVGEHEAVAVGVPNSFNLEWLKNKYHAEILGVLRKYLPTIKTVEYRVAQRPGRGEVAARDAIAASIPVGISQDIIPSTSHLDQRFSFESFVVGNNNRLAYATSQAVAGTPGTLYNPLFIYGGVGLGKTHLVQAIGNQVLKNNPKKKVVYVSCEQFTSEFIAAISSGNINQFKNFYRNADVLLIDDIQFLSHKEGTQEEFFHTFNALQQKNRQIVLTSDRIPSQIPAITDRLSSRFGAGMVADIKAPNYETRVAILKSKCLERGYVLPDDVIEYIAKNIESNIRELGGALMRVVTHAQIHRLNPSVAVTEQILGEFVQSAKTKNLTSARIIGAVAKFFSINEGDILGPRRNKELVYPRQITMYLLRHELNYSYPKIGQVLGGKDHTTIMYGVGKIKKELPRSNTIQSEIGLIKENIYSE